MASEGQDRPGNPGDIMDAYSVTYSKGILAHIDPKIIKAIWKRFGIKKGALLACGATACAWKAKDERVVKLTRDPQDAYAAEALKGTNDDVLVKIYEVGEIPETGFFIIVTELVTIIEREGHLGRRISDVIDNWPPGPWATTSTDPVLTAIIAKANRLEQIENETGINLLNDAHPGNWGLRKPGDPSSLVLFDFGLSGAKQRAMEYVVNPACPCLPCQDDIGCCRNPPSRSVQKNKKGLSDHYFIKLAPKNIARVRLTRTTGMGSPGPGEWYHIDWVFVPPDYRGQGLGDVLMEAVIKDADRYGVSLDLDAAACGGLHQAKLEAWYRGFGFEPRGVVMLGKTRATRMERRVGTTRNPDLFDISGQPWIIANEPRESVGSAEKEWFPETVGGGGTDEAIAIINKALDKAQPMLQKKGLGDLLNGRVIRVFQAEHKATEFGLPPAGFYSPDTKELLLNSRNAIGLAQNIDDYVKFIIHEIGHSFWYERLGFIKKVAYHKAFDATEKHPFFYVSSYARQNYLEDFAETFAWKIIGKLKTDHPAHDRLTAVMPDDTNPPSYHGLSSEEGMVLVHYGPRGLRLFRAGKSLTEIRHTIAAAHAKRLRGLPASGREPRNTRT